MTTEPKYVLFYVLNGLMNGERGCMALSSFGYRMGDGHYYLLRGRTDPDDRGGPFESQEDAKEAAEEMVTYLEANQRWLFPPDGSTPRHVREDVDDPLGEDNVAVITKTEEGTYVVTLDGSYENLTLTITAPSHEAVADVYRHLLVASARYQ